MNLRSLFAALPGLRPPAPAVGLRRSPWRILVCGVVLGSAVVAFAPAQDFIEPAFTDFPVGASLGVAPAPFRLPRAGEWQPPDDETIRRYLATESQKEPNFAGVCRIVVWGCGTECAQAALIDLRDGVYRFLATLAAEDELVYRPDSRLLQLRPRERVFTADPLWAFWLRDRSVSVSTYYEWTGKGLRLLRKIDWITCPEMLLQRIMRAEMEPESAREYTAGITIGQTVAILRYLGFAVTRSGTAYTFRRADVRNVLTLQPAVPGSPAARRQLTRLARLIRELDLWREGGNLCSCPRTRPTEPTRAGKAGEA